MCVYLCEPNQVLGKASEAVSPELVVKNVGTAQGLKPACKEPRKGWIRRQGVELLE